MKLDWDRWNGNEVFGMGGDGCNFCPRAGL